jgi:Flp pilus assembly protein TadD
MKKFALTLMLLMATVLLITASTKAASPGVEEFISRARDFSIAGSNEEALAEIERGLKLYPDSQILLANQFSHLINFDRYTDAKPVGEKMATADPDFAEIYTGLAFVYDQLGDDKRRTGAFENALRAYDKRLKLTPDDLNAKAQRALVIDALGRKDEAAAIVKEMLLASPDNGEAVTASTILKTGGLLKLFER